MGARFIYEQGEFFQKAWYAYTTVAAAVYRDNNYAYFDRGSIFETKSTEDAWLFATKMNGPAPDLPSFECRGAVKISESRTQTERYEHRNKVRLRDQIKRARRKKSTDLAGLLEGHRRDRRRKQDLQEHADRQRRAQKYPEHVEWGRLSKPNGWQPPPELMAYGLGTETQLAVAGPGTLRAREASSAQEAALESQAPALRGEARVNYEADFVRAAIAEAARLQEFVADNGIRRSARNVANGPSLSLSLYLSFSRSLSLSGHTRAHTTRQLSAL